MINNKEFNEWLEKEKNIYLIDGVLRKCVNSLYHEEVEVDNDWFIGLMTQWLLDNLCSIYKYKDIYFCVRANEESFINIKNTSLYDCLVEAINKLGEQHD